MSFSFRRSFHLRPRPAPAPPQQKEAAPTAGNKPPAKKDHLSPLEKLPPELIGKISQQMMPLAGPVRDAEDRKKHKAEVRDHIAMTRALPKYFEIAMDWNPEVRATYASAQAKLFMLGDDTALSDTLKQTMALARALDLAHVLRSVSHPEGRKGDFAKLVTLLQHASRLESINLNNNGLSEAEVQQLPWKSLQALKILSLQANNIVATSKDGLGLHHLSALEELNLEDNSLGSETANLQLSKLVRLKKLNLNTTLIAPEGVKTLGLDALQELEELRLATCLIGPLGAKDLPLGKMPHLRVLDLDCNMLGPEGARELQFDKVPDLKVLSLEGNGFGPEGGRALSLHHLENLEDLNIAENVLGDEGVRDLSYGTKNLQSLNVDNNKLQQNGFRNLKLTQLTKLTKLYLRYNSLGDDGISHLDLSKLTALKELHLNKNKITAEGVAKLPLEQLKAIKVFDLTDNPAADLGFNVNF